jgi:hypothetical protein
MSTLTSVDWAIIALFIVAALATGAAFISIK